MATPDYTPTDPALFYTGLVASLYTPLRGSNPDPEICARFIERFGEPALELGCGSGDPSLELRRRGLDVDGIDSSPDMLDICRARAKQLGVEVNVYEQRMETMDLDRRYRSIFVAGPTFNLILDDDIALAALRRIAAHLEPDGMAMIPLFIPSPVPAASIGKWRDDIDDQGRAIRFTAISTTHDADTRLQTSVLRYERDRGTTGANASNDVEAVERSFVLHWYTVAQFRDLATEAGLRVDKVKDITGAPAPDDATYFVFRLRL